MKKYTTLMLCSPVDHDSPFEVRYLDTLVGIDDSTYSERERKAVETAGDFGETYWAEIEQDDLSIRATTDLCNSERMIVSISIPAQYGARVAVHALSALVRELL